MLVKGAIGMYTSICAGKITFLVSFEIYRVNYISNSVDEI